MRKCHSEHMKVAPNKIKVTLTFDSNEMYIPVFLADKYADGCVANFLKEIITNSFKNDFIEDLNAATSLKTIEKYVQNA